MTRTVTLIQGPPGAGKTKTAVALAAAWVRNGVADLPILVCGDSNTAVDNLADGLNQMGIRVARVAKATAVRESLQGLVCDMGGRDAAAAKRQLSAADAVLVTCAGAGSSVFEKERFSHVLIDEAGQATEPMTLIPITRGCRQLVLVGDHHQLPPTVVSKRAEEEGLANSLFGRLADAGCKTFLLDTQYRMHPAIADFPASKFYHGGLKSDVNLHSGTRPIPPGFAWPRPMWPVCFMAVKNGYEGESGNSYNNDAEAQAVRKILREILSHRGGGLEPLNPIDCCVITPYSGQVSLIQSYLGENSALREVEVNSVDGFQGREKELVVVSAVRANESGECGFLSDWRRLNVTLTRARRGVIVVGNPQTLRYEKQCWAPWLEWAESNGLVYGTKRSVAEGDYAEHVHNTANMQRLFGGAPRPSAGAGEAGDSAWDAPKEVSDTWDDEEEVEPDGWDDSPQLKPAATPETPPSPGGGRFSLTSPKQTKPKVAAVAAVVKPKTTITIASPVRRPEEELDKHAVQLAKLDVAQEGGQDQLLTAARKRVDEAAVAALIVRVALTKGTAQGNGAKGVIQELDVLMPTVVKLVTDKNKKAEDGQMAVLKLCESWFSAEGGLVASAERMNAVGKAVPKVLHALYDADCVEEDGFSKWWGEREKSAGKGEAGRLFEEQAGKFLEWLAQSDEESSDDEEEE